MSFATAGVFCLRGVFAFSRDIMLGTERDALHVRKTLPINRRRSCLLASSGELSETQIATLTRLTLLFGSVETGNGARHFRHARTAGADWGSAAGRRSRPGPRRRSGKRPSARPFSALQIHSAEYVRRKRPEPGAGYRVRMPLRPRGPRRRDRTQRKNVTVRTRKEPGQSRAATLTTFIRSVRKGPRKEPAFTGADGGLLHGARPFRLRERLSRREFSLATQSWCMPGFMSETVSTT